MRKEIESRGYVDEILGLRTITTRPTEGIQSQLLNLIASNGKGSRVRILIWAQTAVNVNAQVNNRSV
ncbi:hypothetical protein KQX54_000791 [Cotesia glomerata]|uniref:Uncharacterized protein n=1 Tax=Cotesia glomerata TaxID=32391 RepID=A0AAV7HQG5_COTGL|nr:hypothetical protein KQX54_000791 [Cotesia glomerata]